MTPQPDFLRPVRGPHPLAWAACGTALLVLGVSAFDARSAWQAREQALAELQTQTQTQTQTRAAPPRPSSGAPVAPGPATQRQAEADAERAVRQAAARLERPWPALFVALDAAQAPGVAWLALDIGEAGALRLEGLAPDAASAAVAAARLQRALPQGQALLGRLDAQSDGAQRFELVARGWR